eukprot:403335831
MKIEVFVNVYDILKYNKFVDCLGIGVYHTGVEVNGSEYAYGGNSLLECTGVYEMSPKDHDVFVFKQSLLVGVIDDEEIIWSSLHKLMKKFRANQYDMLKQNCNTFTNEFLMQILGRGLPKYLNRIANIGAIFHCIVPKKYLIVKPPQEEPQNSTEMKSQNGGNSWDVMTQSRKSKSTNLSGDNESSDDEIYSDDGDSQQYDSDDIDDDKSHMTDSGIKSDEHSSLMFDSTINNLESNQTTGNIDKSSSQRKRKHRNTQRSNGSKSKNRDQNGIRKSKKSPNTLKTRGCKDKIFGFLKIA